MNVREIKFLLTVFCIRVNVYIHLFFYVSYDVGWKFVPNAYTWFMYSMSKGRLLIVHINLSMFVFYLYANTHVHVHIVTSCTPISCPIPVQLLGI